MVNFSTLLPYFKFLKQSICVYAVYLIVGVFVVACQCMPNKDAFKEENESTVILKTSRFDKIDSAIVIISVSST